MKNNTFYIDDITWNDLNMDEVYSRLNTASSSVGREYLKTTLRTMQFNEDILKSRSEKSDFLCSNNAVSKKIRTIFKELGISKKISFKDYIFRINEVKASGNTKHYILIILLLLAIALLFIKPVAGIIAIVVMISVNIGLYFKDKSKVESYFLCLKYLAAMVITAEKLGSLKLEGTPFEAEHQALKDLCKAFASVRRGSWLITNSVSGSLIDVVMDYIRMLFHVDLIKFNNMKKTVEENLDSVSVLYDTLGEFELALCIGDLRNSLQIWTEPDFSSDSSGSPLSFTGLFHPLIKEPVKNSLEVKRSVLLTGSNASGKSTFLKCIALNQLFAQTVYTCLAEEYNTRFCKLLSSMALTDNILNNESYFVVEIKSLKRIFDENGEIPVMCFIDEVLRGTNTKERIAASYVLLKELSKNNFTVFAATHDIELTSLLADFMDNYHFSEKISDNDVSFDYLVHSGPSTTRNAIRLLEKFGFEGSLIAEAEATADNI